MFVDHWGWQSLLGLKSKCPKSSNAWCCPQGMETINTKVNQHSQGPPNSLKGSVGLRATKSRFPSNHHISLKGLLKHSCWNGTWAEMWLTDVDRSLFGIVHLMPIWMSDVGFGVYILIHFVYCVYWHQKSPGSKVELPWSFPTGALAGFRLNHSVSHYQVADGIKPSLKALEGADGWTKIHFVW